MSTNLTYENMNSLSESERYNCSDESALKQSYNGNITLNFPEVNKGLAVCGLLGVIFVTVALIRLNNKINNLQDKNKTTTPNTPMNYPNGYYTYNPNGYYVQPNPYENPVDPNTYIKK